MFIWVTLFFLLLLLFERSGIAYASRRRLWAWSPSHISQRCHLLAEQPPPPPPTRTISVLDSSDLILFHYRRHHSVCFASAGANKLTYITLRLVCNTFHLINVNIFSTRQWTDVDVKSNSFHIFHISHPTESKNKTKIYLLQMHHYKLAHTRDDMVSLLRLFTNIIANVERAHVVSAWAAPLKQPERWLLSDKCFRHSIWKLRPLLFYALKPTAQRPVLCAASRSTSHGAHITVG